MGAESRAPHAPQKRAWEPPMCPQRGQVAGAGCIAFPWTWWESLMHLSNQRFDHIRFPLSGTIVAQLLRLVQDTTGCRAQL
jgi:hypothetical protein